MSQFHDKPGSALESLIPDWVENNRLPNGEKAKISGKTFIQQLQSLRAQIEKARREARTKAPAPKEESPVQKKTDTLLNVKE